MELQNTTNKDAYDRIHSLDEELSKRFISLDPSGYFLIKLDQVTQEIVLEHYSNDIDAHGRAIDTKTGKIIGCREEHKRIPTKIFRGRSAKEIGIQITEGKGPLLISKLDHALYLGREIQKAEDCLVNTKRYIQD